MHRLRRDARAARQRRRAAASPTEAGEQPLKDKLLVDARAREINAYGVFDTHEDALKYVKAKVEEGVLVRLDQSMEAVHSDWARGTDHPAIGVVGLWSGDKDLASQHNTRDGQTPRSHTQCPPYNLCSATSRDRFLSTPAVLSTLPAAFAPFARALRARPSPLFPRGAFLGAVPLGPLEQTPQHQPAVEAEPPPEGCCRGCRL